MFDLFTGFPMVEAAVVEYQAVGLTTDKAVSTIFKGFNEDAYGFCKSIGALVNNSAEEFAMQWMNFYNKNVCLDTY